jgi:hypothetical protein
LQVTTLQGAQIATNDDWGQGDVAAIKAAGDSVNAFGLEEGSTDAAMILTLSPGSYTAIVRGNGDSTGLAMVEVYDIDKASASRLTNLSTRAQVGTDSLALIGGVTVTGNRKVLIRGVGPTLSLLGVGGTLVDPQLAITTLSGAAVANNDDWGTPGDPNMPAAISATQAFGLLDGSKDAALILTLSDGLYTGTITGKNGGTGVGMIEVYEVP